MAIKLLLTWDMVPGREQEYFEFLVREFVPGLQKLGIEPAEAWYTTYGDSPQMLTEFSADDLQQVRQALDTDEWAQLNDRLLEFVTNFNAKIVRASGGFQM
ncbi:MAG: hypothetical protein GTO14_17875 [Anaerolineales bacterium]|nr:hypothetical protein [Anaerolineales bacterium]